MNDLTLPNPIGELLQPGVPLVAAIVDWESKRRKIVDGREVGVETFPPAWLVALRDARCDLCWGTGFVDDLDNDGGSERCPDCHDGRLLHDVRVECSGCWYRHVGRAEPNHTTYCDSYRTVRCLVDVVPVVSWRECRDDPAHVCVGNDAWALSGVIYHTVLDDPGETEHSITTAHVDALAAACGKPPADWVGKYAVILTTTDQEAE